MKNMIKLPAIVLGLMLLLTGINQKVMAQDEDVSLQTFYDELSPYGTWIQDSQYGYVWRPDVDQEEFRPYYTNGHWAMTEYGNTWVSDYDWGWGPFHYGRWVTDRYNRWLWIPDTTWGPAWVNWRSGGGNYGWAPLGPSISIGFNIPSFWWVFVPQRNIYSHRFSRYDWSRNHGYFRNTTIINNVYVDNRNTYYTGPRRDEIRRATNRDVRVYSINRSDRPGRSRISNNTLHMYNPRPNRGVDNRNAAPRNIAERGEIARGNNPSRGRNTNGADRGSIGNPRSNSGNNIANDRSTAGRPDFGARGRNERDDRMERPQSGRDITNPSARPERRAENRSNIERVTRDRGQVDQQRAEAMQQRRQQQAQQSGQRDMQDRSQQQAQQREQRSQQQAQQRQQMEQQRNQQQMQQREQRSQQAQQQRSQQQMQQREQRSQQRQQQMQQRQQMPRAAERIQRVEAPQRSMEARSNGGERSGAGAGRSSRGGGRG